MNCPYCGKPMQMGYLQSARPFFWGPEKHSFFFAASKGEVKVSEGLWDGCYAESWYCVDCHKLVMDVKRDK